MTPIDIHPADLETVRRILREHVPALEVRAFGSRVAWHARETSDLDLALMTDKPLTVARIAELRAAFTDADLPFRVDIVDWASTSEAFRRVVEAEHAVLVDGSGDHHRDARPVRSIEDVCLRVTSGGTPSRRQPSFYEDGCWAWLKTQELRDGWLYDSEEHITDDAVASSSARVLPENTVLMAMYGATVGQLGILRRPMACNQACCAMIVDPGQADYRYLFYQLLHVRPRIKSLSTGAAQQNLSGQLIKSLKFPFPALSEQRAIAHILGTLDDKIELNRRTNATLEAMARALFRSWFVDFDPVRAKMEGRDTGLPKDIADLFPDRLVDSGLGEIPEGWVPGALGDIVSLNPESWGAGDPPKAVAYVDLTNTKWGCIERVEAYPWEQAPSRARRVLRKGDTIVATVRPGNGSFALIDEDGLTGSTGFAVLRPRRIRDRELVWCAATSSDGIDRLAHLADGGAYPAVRPDAVMTAPIVLAGDGAREAFASSTARVT